MNVQPNFSSANNRDTHNPVVAQKSEDRYSTELIMRQTSFTIRFVFVFFLTMLSFKSIAKDIMVVGYLPSYRFHMVDKIELDKLTHLCIGFANPDENMRINVGYRDIWPIVTRARAKNVKVILSLAGGALGPTTKQAWKDAMQPWNRTKFVQNLVYYTWQYQLDGLDVDLEWHDVDENYSGFVTELKDSLAVYGKTLSAALPGHHRYPNITDQALAAFDFLNLMTYDLTGPWDPSNPGQHSPYSMAQEAIDFWKGHGVAAEKLNIGLPFFGWDFTWPSNVKSVSYMEMVEMDTSFAHVDQVGKIYYNGIPMIRAKTQLAVDRAGGIMIWELGQDSFDERSLLRASHNVINASKPRPSQAYAFADPDGEEDFSPETLTPLISKGKKEKIENGQIYMANRRGELRLVQKVAGLPYTLLTIPDFPRAFYPVIHLNRELLIPLKMIRE